MRIAILVMILLIQVGCTTGIAMSDNEEFWFNDQSGIGPRIYYCRANKTAEKGVQPACYQAEFFKVSVPGSKHKAFFE